jgi:AcrR family transcriptional regulator
LSPRPKHSLDLETILFEAAKLADSYGFGELTLANLAKELGIKPPSLYNHFEGLAGLRRELGLYGTKRLYKRLADSTAGVAADEVFALSRAYHHFVREHPGVYEATLTVPKPEDVEYQQEGGKIVSLVLDALKGFELEEEKAIHAVRGLRSLLHGFATLENLGGFGIPLDVEKSLELTLKSFLSGLKDL